MVTIYALELEHKKWYIGKSTNHIARILDHFKDNGSSWTQKYKPIRVDNIYLDCDDFDEDKYVKIYMNKYDINNVRGGSYSQIKLSNGKIKLLENEIIGSTNKCFNCHKEGHFIKDCPEYDNLPSYKGNICFKCGRRGHLVANCYARAHIDGTPLTHPFFDRFCYKCGREGHWRITCNEKDDIYGRTLVNVGNVVANLWNSFVSIF